MSPAIAQTAPSDTGWTTVCASNKCQIRYARMAGGREVTHLLIYKVGDAAIVEYLVPLGVSLRQGIIIQIDGKYEFPTLSSYCDPAGCVGFAPLQAELLGRLKQGKNLKIAFQPHGETQFFSFDYTLTGFSHSYEDFSTGKASAPAVAVPAAASEAGAAAVPTK